MCGWCWHVWSKLLFIPACTTMKPFLQNGILPESKRQHLSWGKAEGGKIAWWAGWGWGRMILEKLWWEAKETLRTISVGYELVHFNFFKTQIKIGFLFYWVAPLLFWDHLNLEGRVRWEERTFTRLISCCPTTAKTHIWLNLSWWPQCMKSSTLQCGPHPALQMLSYS